MEVKEVASKYVDYIKSIRKEFHKIPEASMYEYDTSKLIAAELDKLGVEYRRCGLETGWLVTIGGKKPGKTIMLRADMDGLSVTEKTGVDYVSERPGFMHACGHDVHVATLLTTAKILKDMEDELNGTVKLAFQPAEEVALGAKAMIADGALEGVDACFSMHTWGNVPAGVMAVEPGEIMAGCGKFSIDVHGVSSHGSAPELGVDAAVVAAAIIMNLQTIVSREYPATTPVVVTVGYAEIGSRWNVTAGNAHLEGTTRCFSPEVANEIGEKIERIAKSTCEAYRATCDVAYEKLTLPVYNDPELQKTVYAAAEKIVGTENMITTGKISGAEDFCFFMKPYTNVPGVQTFIGSGSYHANHHEEFLPDEEHLIEGAAVYSQVAVDFLNS